MTAPAHCESPESFFDILRTDFPTLTEATCADIVEGLCCAEFTVDSTSYPYLQKLECDDSIYYHAPPTLSWDKIKILSCPIKKRILLQFIKDPSVYFVLYNTQKGKLRIAGKELFESSQHPTLRIIGIMMVSNDKALASQTSDGLYDCFPPTTTATVSLSDATHCVKIFSLSSNSKTTAGEIQTYIDAYVSPYNTHYYPPVIAALANHKQFGKILQLLYYIKNHPNKQLKVHVIWDEADSIYPQLRDYKFRMHDGAEFSFLDFMKLSDTECPLYKTGFVTATEGELLDDFEECATAHHCRQEMSPADLPHYRALHHPESNLHMIEPIGREKNNALSKRIIEENWESHFNVPYKLATGEPYFPKVIINATHVSLDHTELAQWLVTRFDAYCLTFNQFGITLYSSRSDCAQVRTPIKQRRFGEVLFALYKTYKLHDRPLFIVGRRKIDRGLGFHWAPRCYLPTPSKTSIQGLTPTAPSILTDGVEGLIWTDIILGNKIVDIAQATQKAGRGAGVIGQCPQYPGVTHYWGTSATLMGVKTQLEKVDTANTLPGTHTALQAVKRAEAFSNPKSPVRHHDLNPSEYRIITAASEADLLRIMKKIAKEILHAKRYKEPSRGKDNKCTTSLNKEADVATLLDALNGVHGAYGYRMKAGVRTTIYRYALPCYYKDKLHFVIPLTDPAITDEQRAQIDTHYSTYLVEDMYAALPPATVSSEDTIAHI